MMTTSLHDLVASIIWVYTFLTPQGNTVTMGYVDGISSRECSSLVSYNYWTGRPRTAYDPYRKRCAVMVIESPQETESINYARD